MIQAIVFLPLLAAIVAGLGNRMLGNLAAKLITTGALFAAMALSWPIFLGFLAGTETSQVHPVLSWIASGALSVDWAVRMSLDADIRRSTGMTGARTGKRNEGGDDSAEERQKDDRVIHSALSPSSD